MEANHLKTFIIKKFLMTGLILMTAQVLLLFVNLPSSAAEETKSSSLKIYLPKDTAVLLPFGFKDESKKSFHYGVDICIQNKEVLSPVSGVVTFAGYTPAGSGTVSIRTPEGFLISLLQLRNFYVRKGDSIKTGEYIGEIDSSGDPSFSLPHLHIGVRDPEGNYLNPELFFTFISENEINKKNCETENQCSMQIAPDAQENSSFTPFEAAALEENAPTHEVGNSAENMQLRINQDSLRKNSEVKIRSLCKSAKPIKTLKNNLALKTNFQTASTLSALKLKELSALNFSQQACSKERTKGEVNLINNKETRFKPAYLGIFLLLIVSSAAIIFRQSLLPVECRRPIFVRGEVI